MQFSKACLVLAKLDTNTNDSASLEDAISTSVNADTHPLSPRQLPNSFNAAISKILLEFVDILVFHLCLPDIKSTLTNQSTPPLEK